MTEPLITTPPKHPAKYSATILVVLAELLRGRATVLDPMAGVGTLAKIRDHGWEGQLWLQDLEPEWINQAVVPGSGDVIITGDATQMAWAPDGFFEAVATSCTYGNRMADHCNWQDQSERHTYKSYLGRALHEHNTGRMQWGERYRAFHKLIWAECFRVLRRGGLLLVNVSDHKRAGAWMPVTEWHVKALLQAGFKPLDHREIATPRMRHGANSTERAACEYVLILEKP